MNVIDQAQRAQALDISNSFVVVAPAGSGKTEFLSQRYLTLLSTVSSPDHIQFLTHTNKATKEMRERVVNALLKAKTAQRPVLAHEALTFDLATKVLAHDKANGWDILTNPSQLNIQTNDAMNRQLVNHAMLSSDLGCSGEITLTPDVYYQRAALSLLDITSRNLTRKPEVTALLDLVNNDFKVARELIVNLLSTREQWLPIVMEVGASDEARPLLENALKEVLQHIIGPTIDQLRPFLSQITTIARFCQSYAQGEILTSLGSIHDDLQQLDSADDAQTLRAIARLLLTNDTKAALRKSAHASIGFPVMKDITDKAEKEAVKAMRDQYKDLLTSLAAIPGVVEGLHLAREVPAPHYQAQDWSLLSALLGVMPQAVAELKAAFNLDGVSDFIEVSSAALQTLGSDERPSDQLLRVDNTIKHILVDEFQDTNLLQLRFIERLISGWTQDDGRTLTLVGDPMQSIYMFRMANVGLFAHVINNGVGDISLDLVRFSANFRSQSGVIDDVNRLFSSAMPETLDINFGAIPYEPSVAVKPPMGDALSCTFFEGVPHVVKDNEAAYIYESITRLQQQKPNASIAVIARTRNDLSAILTLFRAKALGHVAVDILALKHNEVVRDLVALTKACFDDNDPIAWVDLLRSPLVGLPLAGIERFALRRYYESYFGNLTKERPDAPTMTKERQKIARLISAIKQARAQVGRCSIVDIIRGLFVELKGLSVLRNMADKHALELCFEVLEGFEKDPPRHGELDERIERLFAEDDSGENPVKIMTIHGGKGLEFDYVFIPQCQKGQRSDDKALMVSDVLVNEAGGVTPVLAPLTKNKDTSVYQFVRRFSAIKKQHEVVRTCYVAMTRAKVKTFMTGGVKTNLKGKNPHFLKGSYFSIAAQDSQGKVIEADEAHYEQDEQSVFRRQLVDYTSFMLAQNKQLSPFRGIENVNNDMMPSLVFDGQWQAVVDTVIHEVLEYIVHTGVDCFAIETLEQYKEQWRMELLQAGVPVDQIMACIKHVFLCVNHMLYDPQGLWILSKQLHEQCEMQLHTTVSGKLRTYIIDRAFEDNETQYIIDYKSGALRPGESQSDYCQRMLSAHQEKMQTYSRTLHETNGLKQVVGLYLLPIGQFVTYDEQAILAA